MFFLRLGRLGTALRPLCVSSLLVLLSIGISRPAPAADTTEITGQVIDASGRALPRAYVQVIVDLRGPGAFTNETGRFALNADALIGCQLEASLTGFETTTVPCALET